MQIPETEVTVSKDGVELARRVVTPGEYVFGRGEDVDFQMETPLASRHHARLTVNFDEWLIEDLGSANGTFVNNQAVAANETTRVFPTQTLRVGDATVVLRRVRGSEAPEMSLAPGVVTGRTLLPEEVRMRRYAVGEVVARGGMGAILSAHDQAIRRSVAMKVMLQSGDAGDLARFVEEAQITGQLEHPNIVPVHELGVDEQDQFFYTMKFVRGITLRKVLELISSAEATAKKYPLGALLTIFQKVCDAVAFAHSRGVLHRDLKPENIMLGDFGEVLVMDWGLAKVLGSAPGVRRNGSHVVSARQTDGSGSVTMAGSILGTPHYMAPEQARGEVETMDQRADIYALGAILYHILALRPSITGDDAMAIVEKVARGETEPLSSPPSKARRIPDSLAAVCRKAMALDPVARYQSVPALQAELEAFQNGFATGAEKAGAWKQLRLLVKRNKAASIGLAAVLVVGSVLGTKVAVEGQRANRALAELKKSAPALLQLAESEADAQRFDSALEKIDAALNLDPSLLRAWWERAWVLLGLERWTEAVAALRVAQQHDPAGAKLASILPAVENLGAAPEAERWKGDAARAVFGQLQSVGATGPVLAFGGKLKLKAEERRKLVDQRLQATLGKGNYKASIGSDGLVIVTLTEGPIRSLEPLRGLPVDRLEIARTLITDLEPLRGMPLQSLGMFGTKVADLSPLRGMPLRSIQMGTTSVRDLSPLKGMQLHSVLMGAASGVADLSPLAGMPLSEIDIHATGISRIDALRGMPLTKLSADLNPELRDCSPLKAVPLEFLNLAGTRVSDLSFLRGMPLRSLNLSGTPVVDLAPLRGLPLEDLSLDRAPVTDLSALQGAPLKDLKLRGCKKLTDFSTVVALPRLEVLHCDGLPKELLSLRQSKTLQSIDADAYPGEGYQGARLVSTFWAAYDQHRAAEKKK